MRGFTLIEVMIVAFIVMLGVTGFVTLQSEYVKTDASVNLRSVASKLAQEKLDDLRQFGVVETTAGEIAFNDIDEDLGGVIPAGPVDVAIKTQDGFTHQFTRSWQVIDQYYVDTDFDGSPDTWLNEGDPALPAPLPAHPSQKSVTVEISYQDQKGDTKQVSLSGGVAPIPLGRSIHATDESLNAKNQPQVSYTPGSAPDVIAYDLGGGEFIETSKPVPDIDKSGENNIVQFETIRYIELDSETDKLEQEDFLTVNCSCKLSGVGEGKTAAMTVLQDGKMTVELGQTVTKMTGEVADVHQPDICTRCCADHHDSADTIAKDAYYRLEDGLPHSHYKYQSDGSFVKASAAGDEYDEICRFKRVDGLYELYPDWQLIDVVEFDDGYLFGDGNLTTYTNYTESVVKTDIQGYARPTKPTGRDMTVAPGGYQLIARGIYLDRMRTEHIEAVKAKIAAGEEDWKAITPFYDINLTLLSNWSSSDEVTATITQEDIQTLVDTDLDYYGTYSRGRLEALTDGVTTVGVFGYAYNTSITGTKPVSPLEVSNAVTDDSMIVTVDSKSAVEKFFGLIGDINCLITIDGVRQSCETNNDRKANYVDLSKITIDPDPDQFACTITAPKGKSTPFFSCENVSSSWKGRITFGLVKTGFSVTFKMLFPDGSVVETDQLSLLTGLTETSNREYNLVVELLPL